MSLETEATGVFQWLTCTNKGAEEICKHALALKGITSADLEAGALPDPQSKATVGILARPDAPLNPQPRQAARVCQRSRMQSRRVSQRQCIFYS